MSSQVSLEQCEAYIDTLNFGLKDSKKIEKLREIVKRRLAFEFNKNQTLWSASQALTYVGSHQDEITEEIGRVWKFPMPPMIECKNTDTISLLPVTRIIPINFTFFI